jgi:hypothetical protein
MVGVSYWEVKFKKLDVDDALFKNPGAQIGVEFRSGR